MKKSSKVSKSSSEGNIYDRIFKENAETLFIPIVKQELNLDIKSYKILPEKLPKTLEREVDFLYEVILQDNTKTLIHLEFQTKDDMDMIYRMGLYHGLAFYKYKLPIKHIVIYLGKGKSKMRNTLKPEEIFDKFDLINLNLMDSKKLMSSQIPEVIILGLLGDFKNERKETILRLITKKLKSASKSKAKLLKLQQQLIYLARLRNLEELTIKIVEEMPITYDIETDYLYNKGITKGIVQGEEQTVDVILKIIELYQQKKSIKQIAEITEKNEAFVKNIIDKFS